MGQEYEINPVTSITIGTIGPPGDRTFHLQAAGEAQLVTLTLEKQQADALADGIVQLLEEVSKQLKLPPADPTKAKMDLVLHEPILPVFRVAELGVGYEEESGMVLVVARELQGEDAIEEPSIARFYATREQSAAMSIHAKQVVSSGRPICPHCGEPEDPDGHFCPKRNGHSKHVSVM